MDLPDRATLVCLLCPAVALAAIAPLAGAPGGVLVLACILVVIGDTALAALIMGWPWLRRNRSKIF